MAENPCGGKKEGMEAFHRQMPATPHFVDDVDGACVAAVGKDGFDLLGEGKGRSHQDRGRPHRNAIEEDIAIRVSLRQIIRPIDDVITLFDAIGDGDALALIMAAMLGHEHVVSAFFVIGDPPAQIAEDTTLPTMEFQQDRPIFIEFVKSGGKALPVFRFDMR